MCAGIMDVALGTIAAQAQNQPATAKQEAPQRDKAEQTTGGLRAQTTARRGLQSPGLTVPQSTSSANGLNIPT